jgi:hypothetical protein
MIPNMWFVTHRYDRREFIPSDHVQDNSFFFTAFSLIRPVSRTISSQIVYSQDNILLERYMKRKWKCDPQVIIC